MKWHFDYIYFYLYDKYFLKKMCKQTKLVILLTQKLRLWCTYNSMAYTVYVFLVVNVIFVTPQINVNNENSRHDSHTLSTQSIYELCVLLWTIHDVNTFQNLWSINIYAPTFTIICILSVELYTKYSIISKSVSFCQPCKFQTPTVTGLFTRREWQAVTGMTSRVTITGFVRLR